MTRRSSVLLKFPRATVVTTDTTHFSQYRRFRDEPLRLVAPKVG